MHNNGCEEQIKLKKNYYKKKFPGLPKLPHKTNIYTWRKHIPCGSKVISQCFPNYKLNAQRQ